MRRLFDDRWHCSVQGRSLGRLRRVGAGSAYKDPVRNQSVFQTGEACFDPLDVGFQLSHLFRIGPIAAERITVHYFPIPRRLRQEDRIGAPDSAVVATVVIRMAVAIKDTAAPTRRCSVVKDPIDPPEDSAASEGTTAPKV